jgi:hypothetical protein
MDCRTDAADGGFRTQVSRCLPRFLVGDEVAGVERMPDQLLDYQYCSATSEAILRVLAEK